MEPVLTVKPLLKSRRLSLRRSGSTPLSSLRSAEDRRSFVLESDRTPDFPLRFPKKIAVLVEWAAPRRARRTCEKVGGHLRSLAKREGLTPRIGSAERGTRNEEQGTRVFESSSSPVLSTQHCFSLSTQHSAPSTPPFLVPCSVFRVPRSVFRFCPVPRCYGFLDVLRQFGEFFVHLRSRCTLGTFGQTIAFHSSRSRDRIMESRLVGCCRGSIPCPCSLPARLAP